MSTPEELLAQILKDNKKIAFGQTIGTNADGNCTVQTDDGSILARSPDQISSGSAIALKADDGQWYAVSARESGLVQSTKLLSRKNNKPSIINKTGYLAFTTVITDSLNIVGDRDDPEPVFIPTGYQLISIANLRKEGDSISYNAVYAKKTSSIFYKQVGVNKDSFNRIISPIVQYTDTNSERVQSLTTNNLRVSKIVDGEEESFVEITDAYKKGQEEFYVLFGSQGAIDFETEDAYKKGQEEFYVPFESQGAIDFETDFIFDGGVVSIYGDLCVFWEYEYFGVFNYENSPPLIFSEFRGFSGTYIKASVGYANISTKEIVRNYKTINLQLLSNNRETKTEPIDYPIFFDKEKLVFIPTVFALKQARLQGSQFADDFEFGFETKYIVANPSNLIIRYSNGAITEESLADPSAYIPFDDLQYRLYTGKDFKLLPLNFFDLPISNEQEFLDYFKNIDTFFYYYSFVGRTNYVTRYTPYFQLTDDLTVILFVGRPTEMIKGKEEVVDGAVLYLTRTIDQPFGDSFEEVEYTVFEGLKKFSSFSNLAIDANSV